MTARRHDVPVFQPAGEPLEAKVLMTIDLGGTSPPALPFSATAPFGVDVGAATPNGGAGWSVADVGDLTGSGYDDVLIGAPTITTPSTLGTGVGKVYLVLGSATVNASNPAAVQNWLNTVTGPNLAPNDRVGDLAQLGATAQTNPISGTALNFPFSGVTFTGVASLGASVAAVRISTTQNGILIGAPNSASGVGTAYFISGNFALYLGKTVDLSNPVASPGLNIVTFRNTATFGAGGALGTSVAGGFNILGDGVGDIILGAPGASVASTNPTTPVTQNTGVVYVISTGFLSGSTQTIDVSTLNTSRAVTFAGAATGDKAGFSVADAGDVNGAAGSVDDLLIGAPASASEAGSAYLVYGGSTLAGLQTTVNNVPFISLSRLSGGTGTGTPIPGATFVGPAGAVPGSQLGWTVSAGGDFNGDGNADILLGAPFWSGSTTSTQAGLVYILYGAPSTSSAFLTGRISLANIPTAIQSAVIVGAAANNLAGYSTSQVGLINTGQPTSILIGAPGFNANSGTAYLIPGRAGFTGGPFSLATAESAPLSGIQFFNTTPTSQSTSPPFFGASVSSRIQGTQLFTVDRDKEADFIIGAPGYDVTQNASRTLAGGAQIVQSGFLTVPIPTANTITTTIGVGTPFAPFAINATTPTTLQIFVFGSTTTTPAFMPVTDIDPTSVVVNGVPFPNATLTPDADAKDHVPGGIVDAIITISPRASLNLPNGNVNITISGKTLATSPLSNFTWRGTASVAVTGGSGGGGGGPTVSAVVGPPTGPNLQIV
ncbi:MAG TPA: integrin alpha, partial [Isosphaeraceae bacterium]|nr:integrin alpha [Isosphaeraceae bacterium]